jgi:hypothetical protein
MQTRSQTHHVTFLDEHFPIDIDFDAASAAWKQNKISIGNGSYIYKKNKLETIRSTSGPGRYNLRKRKMEKV